jgi:hypothetical protein
MNLRLPGMGGENDKPAMLGDPGQGSAVDPIAADRSHGPTPSMDFSPQSIDNGSAMAPSAAAPLIRGLVVLAALLAVAGGGLFTMRSLGQRGLIEDPDVKIDIKALTDSEASVITSDHAEVLEDLRGAGEFAQVTLDDVQMNPFSMRVPNAAPVTTQRPVNQETEEQRLARERAAMIAELQQQVSRLRLNSVMAGAVPLAQISGNLVRVGDILNERFTVAKIEGRSVELQAEGQVFVLVIGE